jgi:preprotein translocase subunit SecG
MQTFFALLMFFMSVFLILLVLIQRGRGGGLIGALGGMGGHSAFGTKAGDRLLWFTLSMAGIWILICVLAVLLVGSKNESLLGGDAPPGSASEIEAEGVVEEEGESTDESDDGSEPSGESSDSSETE